MADRFPVALNFAWLKNIFVFGDRNNVSVNVGQGNVGPGGLLDVHNVISIF